MDSIVVLTFKPLGASCENGKTSPTSIRDQSQSPIPISILTSSVMIDERYGQIMVNNANN